MTEHDEIIDMGKWYTAPQALERLEANSGKKLDASYPRYLGRLGRVEVKIISQRVRLYRRADIDSYVVEDRGKKVARKQRQKASERKRIAPPKVRKPMGRPRKNKAENGSAA